jgi:4-hydroxybutyrate dehydrogenase/sulfolactaldehyde 3-reductase
MLPTGSHVADALFGTDGAAEGLTPETLVVDMSTVAPKETDAIGARLSAAGIAMVDAPVGRSSQHAVEGKLLIMVGGVEADVARARPALACLGDTIEHCGPLGSGTRMKVVNNYMSITLNALTAEALGLAEASGLDPETARQVMLSTVAGQGHMGTTYPAKVLKNDLTPGFAIDLAYKDLRLALDLAADLDRPAVTGSVAREHYAQARRAGQGTSDWTALYRVIAPLSGGEG